jgi:enoyl-CoA hydratase
MSEILRLTVDGRVATITLNRPEARNAVNAELAAALESALDRVEDDDEVWAAILSANVDGQTRPVFCAGADLNTVNVGEVASLSTARGGFAGIVFRERRKPIIAAVDGLATAGGLEIVLACDLVVASHRSQFGLAEVKRNLMAGAGGAFRLPRMIGQAAAMEAILTGEPIAARRAYDLGLVCRLVGDGESLDEAARLACQITAAAPLAVYASRRVVIAAAYEDDETLRSMSDTEVSRLLASEDITEGLAAFTERRPPRWSGR